MSFRYDLTRLQSKQQLINFLGIDENTFENVLAFDGAERETSDWSPDGIRFFKIPIFFKHTIPKKNPRRGYRVVWEPAFLKSVYKALARRLHGFFEDKLRAYPHPRTFGYVGGRNIKENAQDHCGHRNLISVDLQDFFPSIKARRIQTLLASTGINETVSDLLSRFVTIEGSLPLGLPTSPTIANAICTPMDIELNALAQLHHCTFSRYADDITFSGDGLLPPLEALTDSINRHEFEIAKAKTRKSKLGQAQYVTGLSVSDRSQPHVPRQKKRRLRQELYYASKYGLDDHFYHLGINDSQIIQHEVNRLDGLVKFTAFHEPRHSARLKATWRSILQNSDWSPSFEPKNLADAPFSIFVDEAEYTHPGGGRVLALAMAASQHQDEVIRGTQEVLDATLSDVWAAGNLETIAKRGLHFSDATQDMRLAYVDRMRTLPFEGYVAMARLPEGDDYEAIYIRLLGAVIRRRLMAAESQFALIAFEQNDKVRQQSVRKLVADAHSALAETNNRRPEAYSVEFVAKPNLGVSVPDFLLGVLGQYLMCGPMQEGKPVPRDVLLFERVRDKYRLILDVDNATEFSRRRPIAPW